MIEPLIVMEKEKGSACKMTINQIYVADPSKLFFLEYRPSVLSSDDINVSVDTDTGLLDEIKSDTTDQTG